MLGDGDNKSVLEKVVHRKKTVFNDSSDFMYENFVVK